MRSWIPSTEEAWAKPSSLHTGKAPSHAKKQTARTRSIISLLRIEVFLEAHKDISYRHNRRKSEENRSSRGASRKPCFLLHRHSSGRGLIFLGNRRAATGRPHLMRVAQGHVLCFPPAVRLHHIERSVIEEGVECPVVPQIVGREALDADRAAKDRNALINGPGGQRLIRVVAREEWPSLPPHLREVGLGRKIRVCLQLLDIREVRFGTIDPDRPP